MMMRAPVETERDYRERLALERVIHDMTRENMIRRDINAGMVTQIPYFTPQGKTE